MRRHFKGGVYWDGFAETCGDISRAAGFQGNTVLNIKYCGAVDFFSVLASCLLVTHDHSRSQALLSIQALEGDSAVCMT